MAKLSTRVGAGQHHLREGAAPFAGQPCGDHIHPRVLCSAKGQVPGDESACTGEPGPWGGGSYPQGLRELPEGGLPLRAAACFAGASGAEGGAGQVDRGRSIGHDTTDDGEEAQAAADQGSTAANAEGEGKRVGSSFYDVAELVCPIRGGLCSQRCRAYQSKQGLGGSDCLVIDTLRAFRGLIRRLEKSGPRMPAPPVAG